METLCPACEGQGCETCSWLGLVTEKQAQEIKSQLNQMHLDGVNRK
jgi:hypothetical protein